MIHSEQPKGGQFKLVVGDLIRLIETQHEHQAEQLAKLGGITGVATSLGVNITQGLNTNDSADLKRREDTFGSNYIPPPKAKGLLELMWEAFQDVTIIVLTISGVLSVILAITVGDHPDTGWIEGACIIFAVLVVTMVTAINDYQKEAQFRALNAVKEDEKIKVIRNGVPAEVSKFGLVVGDIVRVDLGDIVPADGIVFDQKELKLDESAMTGESDLMVKNTENPFLLSGTKVMEGLGKMLVVCVGENSQAGIIKKLILGKDKDKEKAKAKEAEKKSAPSAAATTPLPAPSTAANGTVEQKEEYDNGETQSPLEAKLNRLTILIGKLGTTVALLVFIIMSIRFSVDTFTGDDKKEWKAKYVSEYLQFFIVSITVLVVAIPEGLPLAVTISLAYSVKKMLTDNNLVRHLDACETMGSATTICSDKTGTLTTNRMTVMQIWIGGQEFTSASQATDEMSESTRDVFCNGVCINSTAEILPAKVAGGQPEHTGNKTECALLQFVRDCGVDYPNVRANTEVGHMLTFSSKKKRMSVVVKRSASTCRIYTKGATEVVLGLCSKMKRLDGSVASLDGNQKEIIGTSIIEKYASQGYRTLCLSYRDVDTSADEISQWADDEVEKDLTCIAIVGIEDPVRKEVPDSIKLCHRAGIVVRMVTGDNITTARSIAGKCGIISPNDGSLVIEGQEFRTRVLDGNGNIIQSEFDKIWPLLRVMARSSPKDKYTLVTGLMQSNLMPYGPQIIAVTGDGTNDAPALKKANVGFAMGISGTAVAKDASDIILMDDNFTSIVSAIKWGRNVYDSIAKFLMFQLTVNVVAISLAFLGAVILEQSPLTAVQLLWVNLIMDSFASLALATEPPTQALLERRPYPKTKPLLSKIMTKHIIGQSIYQLVILLMLTFVGEKMLDVPSGRYQDLDESHKNEPTQHMTVIFNTFVWMQLFNELNCRKIHDEPNVLEGLMGNRVYIYVTILQILMQLVIVQCTGSFFNCEPLTASQWGVSIGLGAISMPLRVILRCFSAKWLPAFCKDADAVDVQSFPPVAKVVRKGSSQKAIMQQ
ncbi:calcium-translocating P-type ATPase, PMCA-type [Phytophthora nicotianae]|uniref:Calcium-transporting ATPase n=1 Tax=Phytophthora nicotianae TaxID=4792 RepID=W2P0F8_PHYNI|nr:calcium-translocating P-type ATPase, PMCA-type [Phytophthora nicotianae]